MNSDSPIKTSRDFLSVAVEQSMLSEDVASEISAELASGKLPPSQWVLQRGLLNPVQVDIVQTLLTPSDIVPGHEILGVIGQGGMGVVYRARQLSLDRIVALKTVLISQMTDPSVLTRFEQEAVTVGRLRHPNIVAAFDFGKHAGRLFFAMELVEGEDAEQLVARRGPLDEATAWSLVRQAAAGLSHAAGEGIVHRDIKPANLLLVKPPEGFPLPAGMPMVKIADFGLAFLTTEIDTRTRLTAENSTLGSPHYMAPEQLDGDSFDIRVDIYALGATAYHLLSGQPPFDGQKLSQLITNKLTGNVEPLKKLNPSLSASSAELVSLMMARDPDARIANYKALISRIDALPTSPAAGAGAAANRSTGALSPTTIVERPTTSTREISKQGTETVGARRRPKMLRVSRRMALVVAAALLGIGGLAAILVLTADPDNSSTADPDTLEESGSRDMVQGGIEVPLFDGKGLGGGWQPNTGRWSIADGPQGSKVLAGSGGIMYRPLPNLGSSDGVPMTDYRLSFLVWLNRASAVELNFALEDGPNRDAPRYVLRLEPNRLQLGYRPGRFQPLEELAEPVPMLERAADQSMLVTLERQRSSWWLLVDGDVVGSLPDRAERYHARFGLAVERGPAWFSDFFVTQLVEPAKPVE